MNEDQENPVVTGFPKELGGVERKGAGHKGRKERKGKEMTEESQTKNKKKVRFNFSSSSSSLYEEFYEIGRGDGYKVGVIHGLMLGVLVGATISWYFHD